MADEIKEVKPLSRSEREALIKDKAGLRGALGTWNTLTYQ